MHSSDAFSDYMVTYSVNKSINLSPTLGRLHRVRQSTSLGPTVCLINRSRDKIEESTNVEDKREEELITKLFMMSMEIERLTEQNRQLQMDRSSHASMTRSRDMGLIRQESQKSKLAAEKSENLRLDLQRNHANQMFELKQKLASMQAENRTLNRRVRQNERQLQQMQLKDRINESALNRTKMEASKIIEMSKSMHHNSTNADLGKSIHKEKSIQIDGLRERINRCEQIIRDQKFIISGQKEQLNKQKAKNVQIEERYGRELQFVKRQLDQTQRQNSQVSQQEVKRLQNQIRDWQSRVIKSQEELKDKCLIIANQVRSVSEYEDRCHELERKLQDIQFSDHSRIIRAEEATKLANKQKQRQGLKLRRQLQKQADQIEVLRTVIEQYKANIAEKDNQVHQTTLQMRDRIREKEQQVRRLRRKDRDQLDDLKLSKSLSVDNTMISNKLKTSQVNLGHIVNSVMELRQSHDRSTRLLGRKNIAVKDAYYAQ